MDINSVNALTPISFNLFNPPLKIKSGNLLEFSSVRIALCCFISVSHRIISGLSFINLYNFSSGGIDIIVSSLPLAFLNIAILSPQVADSRFLADLRSCLALSSSILFVDSAIFALIFSIWRCFSNLYSLRCCFQELLGESNHLLY